MNFVAYGRSDARHFEEKIIAELKTDLEFSTNQGLLQFKISWIFS